MILDSSISKKQIIPKSCYTCIFHNQKETELDGFRIKLINCKRVSIMDHTHKLSVACISSGGDGLHLNTGMSFRVLKIKQP